MIRSLFEDEHEDFRASFRTFVAREIAPNYLEWEAAGIAPRDLFLAAGRHGFLGIAVPERFGGAGIEDFRFHQVIAEELGAAGIGGAGLGLTMHNDITTPYFLAYTDERQKERWLPGIASGELITAIAMSEPGAGSDLASLTTSAVRDGDEYVVNGSKTFISNGINSDLVIVAAKTDPGEQHRGISLLVVERGMEGFKRGRNLEKLGMHSQDTAELYFNNVRVPVGNRLGEEGAGFRALMANLAQERMSIAAMGCAVARQAIAWTVAYVKERRAFGRPLSELQNTRFELAEAAAELAVVQSYVDSAVLTLNEDSLSTDDAAIAKLTATEMQKRVVDRCLQLFGGYGYMLEYPIARAYADSRVATIKGGTSEIMKEIIARSLTL